MIYRTLLVSLSFLLVYCSGSNTYRGNWKATDAKGTQFEINFNEKSFSIKEDKVVKSTISYTQNSISIENSIKSYGIQLSDGRNYTIKFPIKNNSSIAVILDEQENILYTLNKKKYMKFEEIYKLN